MKDGKFIVTHVDNPKEDGVKTGDFIIKVNGEDVDLQNAQTKFAFMGKLKVGDSFNLTVQSGDEQKEIKVYMKPRQIKHQFKINENATEEQLSLRSAWTKNL